MNCVAGAAATAVACAIFVLMMIGACGGGYIIGPYMFGGGTPAYGC